jgi:hypothetical protein
MFQSTTAVRSATQGEERGVDWRRWTVMMPTMGFVSLAWTYSIPNFLDLLEQQYGVQAIGKLATPVFGDLTGWFVLQCIILVLGGIAASWLFYRPGNVLDLWEAVAGAFDPDVRRDELREHFEGEWKHAVALSIAFVAAIFLAETFAGGGVLAVLGATLVGWIVALALDLQSEVAFRLRHGRVDVADEVHRLYALPVAVDLIERRGIPTLARARCMRSLLHFFGPHIPIEILVPVERVAEAREALEVEG